MSKSLPNPITVREHLAWAYANLARADAALATGATQYSRLHHMIRARLYKGLTTGTMNLGSIFDDERLKMMAERVCSYCGGAESIAIDHLLPRVRGGGDRGENLVLACRSCNSSKGGRDVVSWYLSRGSFPPLMLLRRYLKIVYAVSLENGWGDLRLSELLDREPPFEPANFPLSFPQLVHLRH
jgi:hypothetical protein